MYACAVDVNPELMGFIRGLSLIDDSKTENLPGLNTEQLMTPGTTCIQHKNSYTVQTAYKYQVKDKGGLVDVLFVRNSQGTQPFEFVMIR